MNNCTSLSRCSEFEEGSPQGRSFVFETFSPFFPVIFFLPELMDERKEFEASTWKFTLEEIIPIAVQYSETREVNPT